MKVNNHIRLQSEEMMSVWSNRTVLKNKPTLLFLLSRLFNYQMTRQIYLVTFQRLI